MPGNLSGSVPTLDIAGPVARIRLNRPRQHNRFELEDIEALAGMLEFVDAERRLRVVVFEATGPSFSAGFDLGLLGTDRAETQTASFGRLCDQVEDLRLPTICALNGSVYGGATDFALACDLRVGVRGSRMMMPPTRLGIQYFHGGLRRYVERLGVSAAKRILLTAEALEAETMLRIGFLDELVGSEELDARVEALATACASGSPDAVRGLKASLNLIARGTADSAEIQARFTASLASRNAREGLLAWKEKRLPSFEDC